MLVGNMYAKTAVKCISCTAKSMVKVRLIVHQTPKDMGNCLGAFAVPQDGVEKTRRIDPAQALHRARTHVRVELVRWA